MLRRLIRTVPLALIAMTAPALADGTVVYEADAGKMGRVSMTDRWQGDTLRVEVEGVDATMLLKDATVYSITNAGGRIMVLPISDLAGMAGASGAQGASRNTGMVFPTRIDAITDTGERRTVAGIDGTVYEVTWRDTQGTTHTSTAVLTDHPRLLEHQAVKMRFSRTVANEPPNPLMTALDDRGLAPLTFGDRFAVLEVLDGAGPAGDFVLPAEPMDLRGMTGGLGVQ
ncbi:hypothetical protein [Roseospira navarrensis]|uniref:DUF4412 domain-containing protein n=1 Tax=Roseospira navarrensis TaxID=140058 RepID=A0A7X1ZD27_9PROT|nr:hypothetical protein [Roseospira navarrensis]MQX36329.1 hypothetical protein [Roseospira navarrensis]